MATTLPFNAATRTSGFVRNSSLAKPKVGTSHPSSRPQGNVLASAQKAKQPTDVSGLINNQFNLAQGRLKTNEQEAGRSALENAQRGAAMRGTQGAGFQTKIDAQAVAEASKPYQELSTGLEGERAGALAGAATGRDQMIEQQRQFDTSANLQRFMAGNEMDINKFSTFINASTALKESGLTTGGAWASLLNGGGRTFQDLLHKSNLPIPNTIQGVK